MNPPGVLPQWFMSFTHGGKFRGALVVSAGDLADAVALTILAGLNPGGHITTLEFPAGTVPHRFTFRLLDADETRRLPTPPWPPDDFRRRIAATMAPDLNPRHGQDDPGKPG